MMLLSAEYLLDKDSKPNTGESCGQWAFNPLGCHDFDTSDFATKLDLLHEVVWAMEARKTIGGEPLARRVRWVSDGTLGPPAAEGLSVIKTDTRGGTGGKRKSFKPRRYHVPGCYLCSGEQREWVVLDKAAAEDEHRWPCSLCMGGPLSLVAEYALTSAEKPNSYDE